MIIPNEHVVERLKAAYTELDLINAAHGIGQRGERIWEGDLNGVDDDLIIVTADGFGHARLAIIDPCGGADSYLEKHGKYFATEDEATEAANLISKNHNEIDRIEWDGEQ